MIDGLLVEGWMVEGGKVRNRLEVGERRSE
jgi:hypothetical protein